MALYEESDYKTAVRHRVKELSTSRKPLTLKRLAERIPIQYTYLSKALNDEKTHLSEDALFALAHLLEFYPEEVDYLFLLRAHATAARPERKQHLLGKIRQIQKAHKLNASIQDFSQSQWMQEMGYLFDPLSVVVHVAMSIKELRADPRKLCPALGIDAVRLQEILRKLAQLDFIELSEDGRVEKMLKGHIHYGTGHPLMRVHQHIIRTFAAAKIITTPEQEKHNFMATFSGTPEIFEKIKEAFQRFVKDVEKLAIASPQRKHLYQIQFDLFRWL